MFILQTPTNADKGTEKATQGGDESSTEIPDQTDTSHSEEKDGNLKQDRQNDQQLARDTDDLEQTQHAKEPPKETKEPGPQEIMETGPAQGPKGPQPVEDPSLLQTHEPEEPEAEPTETQKPSPSLTQNPADKKPLEQNVGQQPTDEGIPQEPSQLQTQNPGDTSLEQTFDPQAAQKDSPQETQEPDQQDPDQQPKESGQRSSVPGHTEETDLQKNETKENNQTYSTPPTEIKTTIVETSAPNSEEGMPSVSDDIDSKSRPQNSEDEGINAAYKDSLNPPADVTNTNETHMEPDMISQNNSEPMEKNFGIPDAPKPPYETDPTTSHDFINDQDDETTKESEKMFEPDNKERKESNGEKNDKPAEPSVSTETTGQEGEDQTLQTKPDQEQGVSYNFFKVTRTVMVMVLSIYN